jgi:general secretion pathway protein O
VNFFRDFVAIFPLLWLTIVGIFGCIIGSFLNVVIYRLPLMLERRWRREALLQLEQPVPESMHPFNLILPRSCCPHCSHQIRIRDNIPLLSYLYLKGETHCCGQRIPYHYPLVEMMCAMLFMLAAWKFSLSLLLIGSWIFLSMLLVLAIIDYRTYLLPDILTLPLLWLGLLFNLPEGYISLEQAVVGAISGYLCLWCLYWAFRFVTGKEALGYGDFKLLAALGAWMGWQALPQIILLAAGSGLIVTLLVRSQTQTSISRPLAFGPWLALSAGYYFLIK